MKKIFLLLLLISIILSGCKIDKKVNGDIEDSTVNQEIKKENNLKFQIDNAKCVDEYDVYTTIDEIDTIKFGRYPQDDIEGKVYDDIEWIVLKKDGNKAYLISKYILDAKEWNRSGQDCSYEESSIRKWLNNDFYSIALKSYDDNIIIESKINDIERNVILTNQGISEQDSTEVIQNEFFDKVSLLGYKEAKKYFRAYDMSSEELMMKNGSYGTFQNKLISTKYTKYGANNGKEILMKDGEPTYFSDEENRVIEYLPDVWFYGNNDFWLRTREKLKASKDNTSYKSVTCYGIMSANRFSDVKNGVRPTIWVKY